MRGMKATIAALLALAPLVACGGEESSAPADDAQRVEAACGQCQFGMEGEGCDLAVRFGGQTFWVDGTGIDDHGDAHAEDGLCNAVREGWAVGEVVEGRFQVASLELE